MRFSFLPASSGGVVIVGYHFGLPFLFFFCDTHMTRFRASVLLLGIEQRK